MMHKGEWNPSSRLTVGEVEQIRELLRKGWPQVLVAAKFGISQPHVSNIGRGFKWPKTSMQSSVDPNSTEK